MSLGPGSKPSRRPSLGGDAVGVPAGRGTKAGDPRPASRRRPITSGRQGCPPPGPRAGPGRTRPSVAGWGRSQGHVGDPPRSARSSLPATAIQRERPFCGGLGIGGRRTCRLCRGPDGAVNLRRRSSVVPLLSPPRNIGCRWPAGIRMPGFRCRLHSDPESERRAFHPRRPLPGRCSRGRHRGWAMAVRIGGGPGRLATVYRPGLDLRLLADPSRIHRRTVGGPSPKRLDPASAAGTIGLRRARGRTPRTGPRDDWRCRTVTTPRSRALPVGKSLALAAIPLLLHLLGHGGLGPLPLAQPDRLPLWWRQRGPLLASFAAGRELLCAFGCYLWALWTIATVANWLRSTAVLAALLRWNLPCVRWVARTAVGASVLGTAILTNAVPSSANETPHPTLPLAAPQRSDSAAPLLHLVPSNQSPTLAGPGVTAAPTPPVGASGSAPRLRYMSGSGPAESSGSDRVTPTTPPRPGVPAPPPSGYSGRTGRPTTTSVTRAPPIEVHSSPPGERSRTRPPARRGAGVEAPPSSGSSSSNTPPGSSPPAGQRHPPSSLGPARPKRRTQLSPTAGIRSGSTGTWTVHPGDDLWSIAATTLTRAWSRIPTDREVAPYWLHVVQVNRPSLPNPRDANLLLPGDRVLIPAPPMRPAG